MARSETQSEWVREISALTVASLGEGWAAAHCDQDAGLDEVPAAELFVARLRVLATAAASGADCTTDGCGCELRDRRGGADICRLTLELRAPGPFAHEVTDRPALLERYLEALCDAAGAVKLCRRVQHPSGRCWFSAAGPQADMCGLVLAAAHHLGG
jgi:hypothetical protein